MSSELAIDLRGVVKRYGPITAVDGLDVQVPAGGVSVPDAPSTERE
jgi:ABC-type multidrug transport system ATPase subunit